MKSTSPSFLPWHAAGALLLLTATLATSSLVSERVSEPLARPLAEIDWNLAGFAGTDNPALSEGVLGVLLPTSYLSRTYTKPGLSADLFIAFYAQQRAGESMHSPRHCLPGSGWEIWDYGSTSIPVGAESFTVNKYSIANSGERMLVLYWYQTKNRIIASEYEGKLILAKDALLRNSTAASIVRIIVPDKPGALEDARKLASEVIPQMQVSFGS
jgi:EpsI family protein